MSREVCGICWCPYDEAGKCACKPPPKESVTLKPVLYASRRLTDEEVAAVINEPPCATQECMPSQCPNCASLEEQNTELDKKLADLEQTSLELCETCGWRTLIPGDCCLNCTRSDPDELTVAYMMGAQSRMRRLTDEVIADLWYKSDKQYHKFAHEMAKFLLTR